MQTNLTRNEIDQQENVTYKSKKIILAHINVSETKRRLKAQLQEQGMTQRELAEQSGLTIQAVNKWFTPNGGLPSLESLLAVQCILGAENVNQLLSVEYRQIENYDYL